MSEIWRSLENLSYNALHAKEIRPHWQQINMEMATMAKNMDKATMAAKMDKATMADI